VEPSWADRIKALPLSCRQPVACFLAAFRFLTIIPIRWHADQDDRFFQHSLHYFPLLGALIGIAVGALSLCFESFLPRSVVAVLVIFLLAAVSGCLHLDGLADTADGFLSSRPRERILEIMRDSRTGAMGVIALSLVLLLKFAALSSLGQIELYTTIFLMPVAGRCAIVCLMALLPYARKEDGLGRIFYSKHCRMSALWSLIFLLILAPFLGIRTIMLVSCITIVTVLLFSLWCRRKIGGATGDTLGAVCEITEMVVAVGMSNTLGYY
jgi:adenosylcobinamide-GDP ribazoletransferase